MIDPDNARGEADRAGLLWQLNHRIEDLRQNKRELWQYTYAAIAAEAAVPLLLFSKPELVNTPLRIAAIVFAVLVLMLWFAAQIAVHMQLDAVRDIVEVVCRDLGGAYAQTFQNERPRYRRNRFNDWLRARAVRVAMTVAVCGTFALAIMGALLVNR